METRITVKSLYETHRQPLRLEWISGRTDESRCLLEEIEGDMIADVSLAGHLNLIHPHRIQVLGQREIEYFEHLNENQRKDTLEQLARIGPDIIIVASQHTAPDELVDMSTLKNIPLFKTTLNSQFIVNHFQYYLSHALSQRQTLHGVFMEVFGIGVLITGASGIGKSEVALELISRGHRLIADDAPEFARLAPDTINGTCPIAIKNFLEVRGIGVLNVRTMFGDTAIKNNKFLRLIINLEQMTDEDLSAIDRLRGSHQMTRVLDVEIPQITLPVAPGRNLAVLIEAASRTHILALKGYNAADDFIALHQEQISQNASS